MCWVSSVCCLIKKVFLRKYTTFIYSSFITLLPVSILHYFHHFLDSLYYISILYLVSVKLSASAGINGHLDSCNIIYWDNWNISLYIFLQNCEVFLKVQFLSCPELTSEVQAVHYNYRVSVHTDAGIYHSLYQNKHWISSSLKPNIIYLDI